MRDMARTPALWLNARPAGFPALDVALAALMLAVAVASVATGQPYEGPPAFTLPTAVVMGASLAWRRKAPLVTALACAGANLFQSAVAQLPGSLWSLAVLAAAMYSVAAWSKEATAAIGGGVLLVALLASEWLGQGPDYLFIVLVFGGIWLLGRAARIWRARLLEQQLHERDAARLAVAQERLRIARELHDVLGHSMGVIAVQADAAGAALDSSPEMAREPLRAIHATARGSLAEIRAMLELLRGDDDPISGAPGLAQLGTLLDGSALAGLPVTLNMAGTLPPVAPAAGLAIYRVVQESLTNVIKHAGLVPASVSVQPVAGGVQVGIVNGPGAGTQAGTGFGLQGLRERVLLAGGRFEAGAADDGGWRVLAVIPALDAAPASQPGQAGAAEDTAAGGGAE